MPFVLRPMRSTDLAAVTAIDRAAFGEPDAWSENSYRDELRNNRLARYFVLEETGAAAGLRGCLGCWLMVDAVHIVTVSVDPPFQRRGLGEALLLRALDLAQESGCDAVTLECRASNQPALALYDKYGFRQTGRRRRYYKDGEDALIMTAEGVRASGYRQTLRDRRRALRERGLDLRPGA